MITWIKPNAAPSITRRLLTPSTEFCLIFCKAESGWTFNYDSLKKYTKGKQARNYLEYPLTPNVPHRHPTQKRMETQEFLVEMLTHQGQTVLDPFMGSGSTGVACVNTSRKFIGIEMDAHWFDVACRRIENAYADRSLLDEMEKEAKGNAACLPLLRENV